MYYSVSIRNCYLCSLWHPRIYAYQLILPLITIAKIQPTYSVGLGKIESMENGKQLIHSFNHVENCEGNFNGLTKREYFAGLAMQSLLSIHDGVTIVPNTDNIKYMVTLSITAADELISQLNN